MKAGQLHTLVDILKHVIRLKGIQVKPHSQHSSTSYYVEIVLFPLFRINLEVKKMIINRLNKL